ncbi:YheC/YheD family protein [Alkalibacillus haloalkaliphilus]|uniref:ATP-grasp domain-containing protein n=1 Tax=Alkalibacillus haloalkaliphilus TaxID=94136 RepID=A0A511W9Y6_9BACI|nr:YheC/YheD family protein [Alkalibacillus haloalkaliphilus]GEN47168.1 hypothetical protein AHA02nite_29440 [Alkalibacillus haloalkaliphilus]
MTTPISQKEQQQIHIIVDTMIEASEHTITFFNEGKVNDAIQAFSSVVEGFYAVTQLTNYYSIQFGSLIKEIEGNINDIATHVENQYIAKAKKDIKMLLIPNLNNWKNELSNTLLDSRLSNKTVNIGVYYDKHSPLKAFKEPRILSLVNAANKLGIDLYFFSSKDVDLINEKITAHIYSNSEWITELKDFPDAIYNIVPLHSSQQSRIERKLRRKIPFTSFPVGGKYQLIKTLVRNKRYANLLPPFHLITDELIIKSFFQNHTEAVIKPFAGRRGENIYFIRKSGERFRVTEHKKTKIMNKDSFYNWINETCLKNQKYIIQKYINATTTKNEPYDIRAHMQKNGEGQWQITKVYPRIGTNKTILSNISRGGRTEDLLTFFEKEYGDKSEELFKSVCELANNLTHYIDKLHHFSIEELGIDIALDQDLKFWIYEANQVPESRYHEGDRAQTILEYAQYIAINQIFHQNQYTDKSKLTNIFDSVSSKLPFKSTDDKISVGMLIPQNEVNELTVASAYVANYENVYFYYFTIKDIDYEEMKIRGYFYQNHEWVPKIVEYPDVIYDRLRGRGISNFKHVYDEFEGIPFTNELKGLSHDKVEVYDQITSAGLFNEHIIPYKKIERVKDIEHFMQDFNRVILKPTGGSFAIGVHYIEKKKNLDYIVIQGAEKKYYNKVTLTQYLRELLKKGQFVIQEYIETRTIDNNPMDVRVRMTKNSEGKWDFVTIFPRIGFHETVITPVEKGGYTTNLIPFLERNFKGDSKVLTNNIEELSLNLVKSIEAYFDYSLSDIGIDLALDQYSSIKIIELNVNKPGTFHNEFQTAQYVIPYAKFLALNK